MGTFKYDPKEMDIAEGDVVLADFSNSLVPCTVEAIHEECDYRYEGALKWVVCHLEPFRQTYEAKMKAEQAALTKLARNAAGQNARAYLQSIGQSSGIYETLGYAPPTSDETK